jgi:AcrR family transcriptional regulator
VPGTSVSSVTTTEVTAGFRRRLLDGMAAAIRRAGYPETTVADIVREAHTSRRTFYAHFADRQECLIALLRESNQKTIARIDASVDPRAPWETQVRQAIEAWIAAVQADPPVTLSWIRDVPALGERARQLQRETMAAFVVLIQTLTDTPELRAAGVLPPTQQMTIVLLGGLRELIATTVEDGGAIDAITDPAVEATKLLLGPR